MALNTTTSEQHVINYRREMVAQLALRNASTRQIAEALSERVQNPKTGKPFTWVTIASDLQALDEQWQASAVAAISQHKAVIFARLEEIYRVAMAGKDYTTALNALKQERELMGLDAPIKTDNTHHLAEKTDYDLLDELSRIAALATERARALAGDQDRA